MTRSLLIHFMYLECLCWISLFGPSGQQTAEHFIDTSLSLRHYALHTLLIWHFICTIFNCWPLCILCMEKHVERYTYICNTYLEKYIQSYICTYYLFLKFSHSCSYIKLDFLLTCVTEEVHLQILKTCRTKLYLIRQLEKNLFDS